MFRKVDESMFLTFERVKELANKRGLSLNALEEKLGYSRNTLYSLKKQNVSLERLEEIADFFEVSLDYLRGKTNNPNIANGHNTKTVELKEAIAGSMSFDGKPLTEDEINYLADVFELHIKMKDK